VFVYKFLTENGGSMRTVDSKAQKSMPLVEEGSVKAKAEKATGGGSMRLVDSSMKSKTGKENVDR
jgi:hypothetical protein